MKTIPDFKMTLVSVPSLYEDENVIMWDYDGDGGDAPTIAYTRTGEIVGVADSPGAQAVLDEAANHIRGVNLTGRDRADVVAEIEADCAANMASVNAALDVFYS